jgi:tetratricopeptide (TPR) repeat protein
MRPQPTAQGHNVAAIAAMSGAAERAPAASTVWFALGLALAHDGAYAAAARAYLVCVRLAPRDHRAAQNLAQALLQSGARHAALRRLQVSGRSLRRPARPRAAAAAPPAWCGGTPPGLVRGRDACAVHAYSQRIADAFPQDRKALLTLVDHYAATDQPRRLSETLNRQLTIDKIDFICTDLFVSSVPLCPAAAARRDARAALRLPQAAHARARRPRGPAPPWLS